ncbi:Fic family protein [Patescibacteria group bacterium]|nr:Fic family protein [Patescibacteria group bacterium]
MTNLDETLTQLTRKKQLLDSYKPFPPELVKNLEEWYKIELTYTSNALEGNTLSRAETALVVEKGITIKGKTLQEHQESINHANALDFIKSIESKKRQEIIEADILDIHRLILTKIDDNNAGRYRNVPVRIAGSTVALPNPFKVPDLMEEFILWLKAENSSHPATISALAHFKLVSIHPFVDGNGRTARILMNLLLVQMGYPPAVIRKEDRMQYINAIEKAQLGGNLNDFLDLIDNAVDRSLDMYLESAQGILKI